MVSFKSARIPDARSERLIALLQSVASNELLTHKLYADFLQKSEHISPDISELCQTALSEDHGHFEAIHQCIERLNGNPLSKSLNPLRLAADEQGNANNLLSRLCATEAVSVQAYNEICAISMEYDYRIFDLSYRNMNENLAHLDFVSNLLNNLASDHRTRSLV